MDDNRIINEAQEYFMKLCREKDAEIDRLKKQEYFMNLCRKKDAEIELLKKQIGGEIMMRPVIDFKEDSIDWKKIGYLGLIDDLNAMIRTLNEFQAETIRKEAIRQSEEE